MKAGPFRNPAGFLGGFDGPVGAPEHIFFSGSPLYPGFQAGTQIEKKSLSLVVKKGKRWFSPRKRWEWAIFFFFFSYLISNFFFPPN